MIRITDSPRHAGIIVKATKDDLEELYNSLYILLEKLDMRADGQLTESTTSVRMSSLCYDIRHAMPLEEDRPPVKQENTPLPKNVLSFITGKPVGLDASPEDEFATDDTGDDEDDDPELYALSGNTLCEFRLLWPEAIFICFVLNIYLGNYALLKNRKSLKGIDWTPAWVSVRKFQVLVIECLCNTVIPSKSKSIKNLFMDNLWAPFDYCTHYIDSLAIEYISLTPEKRIRLLGLLPSKTTNKGRDYYLLESRVTASARHHGVPVWEIDTDYPEEVDW